MQSQSLCPLLIRPRAVVALLCFSALAIVTNALPPLCAQDAAPAIAYDENITYGKGGDVDLKLDFARPKEGGPFPAIVCIHGGGWRGGSREVYRPLIKELAAKGYAAVTVSYRFAPQHPFPAQVEDVKCAVRYLRENAEKLHIDPDRIGATGASAGGHLSLMLGVMGSEDGLEGEGGHAKQSSRVQCVVNWFGPTDLAQEFPENVRGLLNDFIKGTPAEKPDVVKQASPITYLSKDDAPILTLHGTKDNIVPYSQATLLHKACKEIGLEHELITVEGGGHGWGGEQVRKTLDQTIAFFDRHLKNKNKKK